MAESEYLGQPFASQGQQMMNAAFMSESIMRYRLEMQTLLQDVELYLSGKRVELETTKDGGTFEKIVQAGVPLMNQRGVQSIISSLRLLLGPHTVQGNIDRDQYESLIEEINIYLATDMMINRVKWHVRVEDYPLMIDVLISTILLFISRTIDNKERESYANTVRSIESNTVGQGRKGIMGFFR